jgi:hypothetical protein
VPKHFWANRIRSIVLITPDELKKILAELDIEPSVVASTLGIDRLRVRAFVRGELSALTDEERRTFRDRLLVADENSVAHRREQEALIDGAGDYLRKHSVLYMYEKDGQRKTASGTLVTIEGRLFVATAGHTIPARTSMLEFIGGNVVRIHASDEKASGRREWSGSQSVQVLKGAKHPSYDVGFLELRMDALKILMREAFPLAGLSLRPLQYGRTAFLFGFPSALESETNMTHTARLLHSPWMTYPNPVLAPDEWPVTPADDRSPDENVDCFLRYSRNDPNMEMIPLGRETTRLPVDLPDQLPEVFGMSGGGFWQRWTSMSTKELWFPCDYQLFAIQSSWYEPQRYVRGIQVRHWLDLLAEKCPELKAAINSHVAGQVDPTESSEKTMG